MSHSITHAIEQSIVRSIKEKKNRLLLGLLYVLSLGFGVVSRARHWLYDRGIFTSVSLSIPVVSVGNIVAGGTGKTPTVMALIEMLREEYRIAVISSGYRRTLNENRKIDALNPEDVQLGDEPYLIAKMYPEVGVFSTKDYLKTALEIEKSGAYDLIVLDDGFQKRKLHATCSLVCIRSDDPWGQGYFLPRGFLRDDPKRLAKASGIVVTGESCETGEIEAMSGAPVWRAVWECTRPEALEGGDRVGVFCGVGNPESFVRSVRACGLVDVATHVTVDHGVLSGEQLEQFATQARDKGAVALVCSAKDAVKLEGRSASSLPIYVLSGKLKISYGIKDFRKLLDRTLTDGTRV